MTSNEKFQPGEEMFEDVEGHATRPGRAVPADDQDGDVEGHATRVRVLHSEELTKDGDDTEGHGVRVRM